MKRSGLYVFWNLRDNEGFWRVDAVVYRKDSQWSDQTYRFEREWEKRDFDSQSIGEVMDRAEEYLAHLIKTDATMAKWYQNPSAAP